jgi:hypothetical protein
MSKRNEPSVTIPTDFYMALIKLLDVMPPILSDWIKTTGYGEIHDRDLSALFDVQHAKDLHHDLLAKDGILPSDSAAEGAKRK